MNVEQFSALPQHLLDLPDGQLVVALNSVTVSPIALDDLMYLLNQRGMMTKIVGNDAAKKWTGTVLFMKEAAENHPAFTSEQKEAIIKEVERWLSHITNTRNSSWATDKLENAAPFRQLYDIFNTSGVFAEGDLDAIYELGGGRLCPEDVSLSQVSQLRKDVAAFNESETTKISVLLPFLQARNAVAEEWIVNGAITDVSQIASVFEVE